MSIPRILAGAIALSVNVILVTALMIPSQGPPRSPADAHRESVTAVLLSIEPIAPKPRLRWTPRRYHPRPAVPSLPAMLEVRVDGGPPTETSASVARATEPDIEARVIDRPRLLDECQRAYPNEFTSNEPSVTLRVYVMGDGRIGQGNVIGSSGDEHLDWMTMKCLQAYAHLEPASDDDSPVGSWQRLKWNWPRP